MEKASEKKGLRNLCGYSHGKPQPGEVLGWSVCGEVSSHPEACGHRFHYCWGPEALASLATLTTVTPKAGILLRREVSGQCCHHKTSGQIQELARLRPLRPRPGRGCCTHFLAHTSSPFRGANVTGALATASCLLLRSEATATVSVATLPD